jgi:hypothetical protein
MGCCRIGKRTGAHYASRHLSQARLGRPGRLPQQVLGVFGRKPRLVHEDADGEVNSATGNGLQGQARRLVFGSGYRRHQALVVDQRDQVLYHQVRDGGVALGGCPADGP